MIWEKLFSIHFLLLSLPSFLVLLGCLFVAVEGTLLLRTNRRGIFQRFDNTLIFPANGRIENLASRVSEVRCGH